MPLHKGDPCPLCRKPLIAVAMRGWFTLGYDVEYLLCSGFPKCEFRRRVHIMAHVKKGQLMPSPEWAKHLRWLKKLFWKRERRAGKKKAKSDAEQQS